MGEYMTILNLDKKEKVAIPPLKFWEYMANHNSKVLFWLTTRTHGCMGLGWGDVDEYETLGRWAGDRIIVVGDYDPEYAEVEEEFEDITMKVVEELARYYESEGPEDAAEFFKMALDVVKSVEAIWGRIKQSNE